MKLPDRTQVIVWIADQVNETRLHHIFGVEAYARHLAERHGFDGERAAWAGLFHDVAKFCHPQRLLTIAQNIGFPLDDIYLTHPHLLHAPVGAWMVQQQWGIEDREMLDAIAHHTLGQPGMGPLSRVLFVADAIEPGRGDALDLQEIRQIAQDNLDLALLATADYTLDHLVRHRRIIHPQTLATRNWALERVRQ